MPSSTGTELQSALADIAEIDKEIAQVSDTLDRLKKRRNSLEAIAVEEMTTQRLEGVKVAGRSWRIEWQHLFSAPEARKDAVMEAARKAGLLDKVTTISTTRLKALLTERAKEAGTDARQPYSEGTEFAGVVGEHVRPVLRHRTV